MIDGSHPVALAANPATVLCCDFKSWINQSLGGDTAQTNDDGRLEQCSFATQKRQAGLLLFRQGIPIGWRMAFDDIGDIDILPF